MKQRRQIRDIEWTVDSVPEAIAQRDKEVQTRRDELAQALGGAARLQERMTRVGLTSEQLDLILRDRVLLVHKRELRRLEDAIKSKGTTLIPLAIYFKDGRAKVELAVARGKQQRGQHWH